jgi:hypothetical protein
MLTIQHAAIIRNRIRHLGKLFTNAPPAYQKQGNFRLSSTGAEQPAIVTISADTVAQRAD